LKNTNFPSLEYELLTERKIVGDVIMMLQGFETEIFGLRESEGGEFKVFEIRKKI